MILREQCLFSIELKLRSNYDTLQHHIMIQLCKYFSCFFTVLCYTFIIIGMHVDLIMQDLCSDPTEQTLKPHYPSGGARDVVLLSYKPKHSRHDLMPTTTPGKMHRAGSTSVYCLCRLHEGI